MTTTNANTIVATELSEAMGKCKQKGVDEASLRTGLLTITIANFVNRIGMQNTLSLFQALPEQIASGIFDKYIDPNKSGNVTSPAAAYAPTPSPQMQQPIQPMQGQQPPMGYQNGHMPENFVPPSPTPSNLHPEQQGQSMGMHNPLNNFGPMDGNSPYPNKRRRTE